MTTTITTPHDLPSLAGSDLGHSDWLEIPQSDIDLFADATHDHQWIHVDPEKAKDGPFKETIAHGYLTLSLLIPLWSELLEIKELSMAINYGLNKVRFPAPVPAGAKVRLAATVAAVEEVSGGGYQVTVNGTVESNRSEKPAVVAEMVYRYYA
ncbi:MaoC family dehydratase [Mycolicibacterium austroafricanum]|uniref:MaoC family dehydratase n=1 Tax=Mycolicibacterium austroafricanum TaxID=39687 RepID=UPI00055C2051|nr:MaoC family dehydratase [Mycolicibacterium austroafricanum]QZY47056.1 MaoC family dehydratase [Mycolicibacterium austroafricanum]